MNSLHKAFSVTALLVILIMLGLADSAQAGDKEKGEALLDKARASLNQSKYEEAARLFAEASEVLQPQTEAGNALYWEAFARYRLSRTEELKRAVEILRLQQKLYPTSATAAQGEELAARLYAKLAERGEADAAREITERASEEQVRQETRTAALQALMQMDPRKAMPMLTKIVRDDRPENRELRRNALFIMCQQDEAGAEDLLIELLEKETDPEFLSEIAMCLSMNGSEKSLQALMQLFRTSDEPQVTEAALISLGQNDSDQVFDFLTEIARDTDRPSHVRSQAMMALGMTGRDKQVTQVMGNILATETDPEMTKMALYSLSQVDDPAASKIIMDLIDRPGVGEELQSMALQFATMHGQVDLETLRRLYGKAQSRDMKQQICHVLTMAHDQDAALDLLIEITRTETDPEIKRDAVFWIGQFKSDKAAEYLLEVINQE